MRLHDTSFTYRNPEATQDLIIPIEMVSTTTKDEALNNLHENLKKDVPWFKSSPENNEEIIICGAAPSLKNFVLDIRRKQNNGSPIIGCNSAVKYLNSQDLIVDYQILLDAHKIMVDDIQPARTHLLASIVNPHIFDMVDNPILWHPAIDWVCEIVDLIDRDFDYIGGGISVAMSALCIAYTMGYRKIHLYGVDSCKEGNDFYAYGGDNDTALHVTVEEFGKTYFTTYDMKAQVLIFLKLGKMLSNAGCHIEVHGSGLLPDAWANCNTQLLEEH